jgi:uncharacterized protein YdeI (YjbR/CyaY-like superfamily)
MAGDHPVLPFESRDAWAAWLHAEHARADGVWLKLAKTGSGLPTVTYAEAVEVALCYGWIDGQRRSVDATHYVQRFTPRRSRSKWSRVNCAKATGLIESGAMHAAGLREVERARADGRWDAAYDPPSRATVPEDLQAALDAEPAALSLFVRLDAQNRYAILHRVQDAKRSETRARRIEKYVAMLARGETIYPT